MKVSFLPKSASLDGPACGYGKAYEGIKKSFEEYEHGGESLQVLFNDPGCKVQICFTVEPGENDHYDHQYKIYMSQTETTRMADYKVRGFSRSDEFWTANEWGRCAAINSGMDEKKVFVYHHGIDPEKYTPKLRGVEDKIRFLHIDSGAPRKRADLVVKSFSHIYKKYGNNVELILKDTDIKNSFSKNNWFDKNILATSGEAVGPGIRYITETLSEPEMISLMKFCDVLVYPSEGEGFGLIPLEALSTGMPVISTHEWCSYSKYLMDNAISSRIGPSEIEWGAVMAGDVVLADVDSIIWQMERSIDNLLEISKKYYDQQNEVVAEYSWKNQTALLLDERISRIGLKNF